MITTWILVGIVVILGIVGAISSYLSCETKSGIVFGIITSILIAALISGGMIWRLYGTESGKREQKSFKSNVSGGIEREVKVYDAVGNELEHFDGKFDVDFSEERIIFDDQNGKRHTIYFKTGTVIVNEK